MDLSNISNYADHGSVSSSDGNLSDLEVDEGDHLGNSVNRPYPHESELSLEYKGRANFTEDQLKEIALQIAKQRELKIAEEKVHTVRNEDNWIKSQKKLKVINKLIYDIKQNNPKFNEYAESNFTTEEDREELMEKAAWLANKREKVRINQRTRVEYRMYNAITDYYLRIQNAQAHNTNLLSNIPSSGNNISIGL